MASSSITSWQIDGGTVAEFIFLGSKITMDSDCSHENKRCWLLERKAITNLNSVIKNRDVTLLTKVHIVKTMVFPAVMYGWESWTIKKGEHWRTDALELWCWRRLLRVPWTARRSSQPILKDINPEYSLEGLMLKLKLQYFDHLMWRADSLKTLMLGKIEGLFCKKAQWKHCIFEKRAGIQKYFCNTIGKDYTEVQSASVSCSVMSDSVWPHQL